MDGRRGVCRTEWHNDELFSTVGSIATNSSLRAWEVDNVCDSRANLEKRIKGEGVIECVKTICHKFGASPKVTRSTARITTSV